MRILIGNNQLKKTGGTENFSYALAVELKRQGYEVEYFTLERGKVSELFEKAGIPFMSKERYDLVLANHNTVVEKLWQYGFIVQTCHGTVPELEQPSPFADAFVAVSEEVKNHLKKLGYDSTVILNGIDCNRFRPKKSVAQELTTVLSLCQSDEANKFISKCCQDAGVGFLKADKYKDNVWKIEDVINQSDLVVGLGRSAYDAMACGRCVIAFDCRHYIGNSLGDGMLTPDNIEESMKCNCSGRAHGLEFDEDAFVGEMKKYSPELAAWSREYALEHLNVENAAGQYLSMCKATNYDSEFFLLKKRMKHAFNVFKENELGMLVKYENLQKNFKEKNKKHLRAIRLLAWLAALMATAMVLLLIL